ncbi:MAG: magnesium/cobalt transporter CorA [Dehalococcoidia bacterium]|nr:MAG: magnesium/cobalt transporter CorA [Dehalococcoidia bacterium]
MKIRRITRPPIPIRRRRDAGVAKPTITRTEPSLKSIAWQKLTWVDIEQPTEMETEYLAEHYPFHPLDLDDCRSKMQLPKIDEYEDYFFMIFHFPVFNPEARVTTPSQVAIFIGEDYLITLHQGDLKPLVTLFRACETNEKAREESMGRSSGFLLYLILDRLVNYCFPILNRVGENIDEVEERIFGENPRAALAAVAVLRRDIISFRRIIRPQTEAVETLEQKEWPVFKEDPEIYFGDIADHLRKIRDTLDDYRDVVEGLSDTNDVMITFRTNEVMRVLTIIATITLPLTLVASIYGMNIKLPFAESSLSFPIMVIVMVCIIVGMLAFFRSRRWI